MRPWVHLLLGCFVSVVMAAACGEEQSQRGAYVVLAEDQFDAGELKDRLVFAGPEDDATPSGFVAGLRSSFLAFDDRTEMWGVRIEFDESGAGQSTVLERAERLGFGPVTLLDTGDEWTDCAGLDGCSLVDP